MVQCFWQKDNTLYQTVHKQAGFHILALISNMDDGVTDGKIEILAYVRVEAHDIHIWDSLSFPHFIVETHGLHPATVHGIAIAQWTLSYNRMREQFEFLVKFTFN